MTNNIILIGRGTIAVNCLTILLKKDYKPVAVICDSFDEGKDTWSKSLYKCAKKYGYREGKNLFKQRKVNSTEFIQTLHRLFPQIDVILSIQPYAIFQMPFIQLAKKYVVNLHFAPLPKLRGVAPCSWAFVDGLKTMGVTLHLIEDTGIDNGPIIAQKLFPISHKDTAWTLFNKCILAGTTLFERTIRKVLTEQFISKKQNEKASTYHSMHEFNFNDLEIDTQKSFKEILTFVRSRIFPPLQLPYIVFGTKRLYVSQILTSAPIKSRSQQPVWTRNNVCYVKRKNWVLSFKYIEKL